MDSKGTELDGSEAGALRCTLLGKKPRSECHLNPKLNLPQLEPAGGRWIRGLGFGVVEFWSGDFKKHS